MVSAAWAAVHVSASAAAPNRTDFVMVSPPLIARPAPPRGMASSLRSVYLQTNVHWQLRPYWSQTQAPTLQPSGGSGARPHARLACATRNLSRVDRCAKAVLATVSMIAAVSPDSSLPPPLPSPPPPPPLPPPCQRTTRP